MQEKVNYKVSSSIVYAELGTKMNLLARSSSSSSSSPCSIVKAWQERSLSSLSTPQTNYLHFWLPCLLAYSRQLNWSSIAVVESVFSMDLLSNLVYLEPIHLNDMLNHRSDTGRRMDGWAVRASDPSTPRRKEDREKKGM